MKINRNQITAYKTKDGSDIRELLHPSHTAIKNQSLAEAVISTGQITEAHSHKLTEEIYYILEGKGQMFLGNDDFFVETGDSILIKPGQKHCIKNTGNSELRLLCCCSPAYSHEDTFLVCPID